VASNVRPTRIEMNKLTVVLSKLYWVLVATVPFYPAYELFLLQEHLACAYGTPCFEHGLPFQVKGAEAGIFTGLVLWPICIWKLGGEFAWNRIWTSRNEA
jgi:hypothetical protein